MVLYLGMVLGRCFWWVLRLGCEGQGFSRQPGCSFLAPQEPEAQAAQVSDVPATSRRPEQVSRAMVRRGRCLGPLAVFWPDTPTPTARASQDTWAAQEQELESLREQLEGVNRNIEEVEANMKTLGISLVQVGVGEGLSTGVRSQVQPRRLRGT